MTRQIKDTAVTRTADTILGTDWLPLQAAAGGAGSSVKTAWSSVATALRGMFGRHNGCDQTGVTECASAWNALMTEAASGKHVVIERDGQFNIGSTVTVKAPLHGPTFPYISTAARLRFVPSFSNVNTAVLERVGTSDGYDGADIRNVFIGNPSASSPATATNAIGLKLGAAGSLPETNYRCARSRVENIMTYGLSTGVSVQGWTNDLDNIHTQNCALGFRGEFLNACTVKLFASSNTKDFQIDSSTGLTLHALWESTLVAGQASTIDGCHALRMTAGYTEHAGSNRAAPLLIVGGTTECTNIDLQLSVSGTFDLTAGFVPIVLDRVNGGIVRVSGSSGSMHGLIRTTSNCKNVRIVYLPELGKWPLEGASCALTGPAYNHFPNSNFAAWVEAAAAPRGWNDMSSQNVTISQRDKADGHDVRRGRYAMRLTASSTGVATRSVEFWIAGTGSPTCLALRGKRVRMGAWVWIPQTAEFAESDTEDQHCLPTVDLYSYDTSTTNYGSAIPYNHHTTRNAWNFIWCETDVHSACIRLVATVYLTTGVKSIGVAADAYIDIDSIVIAEASVPFEQFMSGLPDAPTIDAVCEGGTVRMFTDVAGGSTDAAQYFGVGDILQKITPASGASRVSVCVTAGAGGTAGNWKSEQALP